MNKIIFISLFFVLSAQATDWTTIASCITPDHVTGGASIYYDGTDLILQIGSLTENLDEYRVNLGDVTAVTISVPQLKADLHNGIERSIVFTKATSKEEGGIVTDAALIALKVAKNSANTAVNGNVGRRGQVMRLVCNPLAPVHR